MLYSSPGSHINRLTKFLIWLLIKFIFHSSIHWWSLNELINRIKLEIIKSKITSCGILKHEIRFIKFVPGIICSFLIHNLFILIWQIDLTALMIWCLYHALIWLSKLWRWLGGIVTNWARILLIATSFFICWNYNTRWLLLETFHACILTDRLIHLL